MHFACILPVTHHATLAHTLGLRCAYKAVRKNQNPVFSTQAFSAQDSTWPHLIHMGLLRPAGGLLRGQNDAERKPIATDWWSDRSET